MGDKDLVYAMMKRLKEEAEKEGREPSMRLKSTPKEMRPTAESIEKMGKRTEQARKRNPNYNPLWRESDGR